MNIRIQLGSIFYDALSSALLTPEGWGTGRNSQEDVATRRAITVSFFQYGIVKKIYSS